jgi:hypothetical protein
VVFELHVAAKNRQLRFIGSWAGREKENAPTACANTRNRDDLHRYFVIPSGTVEGSLPVYYIYKIID